MDEIVLSLPSDLAAQLLAEDLVTEPLVWRGADIVSLLTLTADMTSAVTTVVVARESIGAVIRRLVHHTKQTADDVPDVTVSVQAPAGTRVFVETNSPTGLMRLEVNIRKVAEEIIENADADADADASLNDG
jgi:hypothetical protein